MKPKLRTATLAYNRLIDLVYLASRALFSHQTEIFLHKDRFLPTEYPTAILGNHVSPLDVPALAIVYRRLKPKIKMIIPTREDMLQRNFLIKEFRPKGLAKTFLHLVDLTHIIPVLLRFIGCVPIKRPFRDNSRELLKKGALREQVEKEWDILCTEILAGRNLFMFPEGTFNRDGYLSQIKRGPWVLAQKLSNLSFVTFTLTYDSLSAKKDLYIAYGTRLVRKDGELEVDFLQRIREQLGQGYTVHFGNLLSYLILRFRPKSWDKDKILPFLLSFVQEIRTRFPEIPITENWDWQPLQKHLQTFLARLSAKLVITDSLLQFSREMFHEPEESISQRLHPLHYYRNQLQSHWKRLDQISFDTYPFLLSHDS